MIPSIDFESRSATDIKLGLDRYFSDPEAAIMMLAIRVDDMPEPLVWHRGPHLNGDVVNGDVLERLLDHVAAGGQIQAWNAMFEFMCWNTLGSKLGWPELKIEQCVDTMARAAAHNLPQGLGRCAEVLGLPLDQQKDKRGKHLIQRLCKPHKPTKDRPGVWVEDAEMFAEFVTYCAQDVTTEEAVARKLRPLTPEQQRIWVLTQKINRRGVPVDLRACDMIGEVVDKEKLRLNKELKTLTAGVVTAASKRNDLLTWANQRMADQGYLDKVDFEDGVDNEEDRPGHEEPMANLKAKTVEAVLAKTDLPADVRRALEIRAAVCQTSTAKFGKMLKIQADGAIRNMFVWHGAGTGRWASRGGLNVQNFARPIISDQDIDTAFDVVHASDTADQAHEVWHSLFEARSMDVAVSCLRGVLAAAPGHDLIDADYSSVENRVGVWLAGQWDKVEMFAKGLDEYKVFASTALYNIPYDAVTKDMRQMSKSAVLGCLFGQGANGLIEYAKGYGVELTPERSKAVVKLYRKEYHKVKDLWYLCQDASIAAVENPGSWFDAGDKLKLICHKNFLWMKLPSGRLISWAAPRVEWREVPWTEEVYVGRDDSGERVFENRPAQRKVVTVESIETKTRIWCRHPLIGSSIFQSGVQGAAADILADGLTFVDNASYPVVLLAHDELMAHVRQGWGDPDEFGQLMCTPTEWRKDLPLAYEAWRGKRFRK